MQLNMLNSACDSPQQQRIFQSGIGYMGLTGAALLERASSGHKLPSDCPAGPNPTPAQLPQGFL